MQPYSTPPFPYLCGMPKHNYQRINFSNHLIYLEQNGKDHIKRKEENTDRQNW